MMRSIRSRLLAGLLALVALISVAVGLITYGRVLAESSALFDYQLQQMALSLRDQASVAPRIVLPAHAGGTDFVIQIWDRFGTLVYSSRPGLSFINRAVLGYADLKLAGERWRVYSLATVEGVIQVAQPWGVRESLAGGAALRVVVPLLLLAPLMAVAAAWIVGYAMAPLRRITAEVQRRDAGSLDPIDAPGLPAEISPLIAELNRLLGRLGAAFEAQRAFVADAAHELRSPLTALSLQLQLAERARDAPERETAHARLQAAVERATHLVAQLLTLARNESGADTAQKTVALAQVVQAAIGDVQPLAQQRAARVEFTGGSAGVRADADALRILVRNLLDNALRYSPEGGVVGCSITGGVLRVTDQGPGIPPAEYERVFARFYRRVGGTESGSGLGLAIVKAIAERHGARVVLGESAPHGLTVSVYFPPS